MNILIVFVAGVIVGGVFVFFYYKNVAKQVERARDQVKDITGK